MWIETLEQFERRPVIILRERVSFRSLSRTWLPVVCVPKAGGLARLDLSGVRGVLCPGNAGKNVHMLRVAEVRHVFIGHGDSDRLAGGNRVGKVYDEIWEGWSDDDRHTSLVPTGAPLVEKLLAQNVRVICKPHPLTGGRSPQAVAADRADRAEPGPSRQAGRVSGAPKGRAVRMPGDGSPPGA